MRRGGVPEGGGRQSAIGLLRAAAGAICVFAHIAGVQAQTYQQVDSLLLQFYPDLPSACTSARQTLHIGVANGGIAVYPNNAVGAASVVYQRTDGAMTFMLGSTGCRVGATIGRDIRGAASGGGGATEWTVVPRNPDDPNLTQTHYDAHNSACESADLYLHLQEGVALLRLASQQMGDHQSDRSDHGLQSPTGPLRGTIGGRGCEIGLLVFRAD